MRYCWGGGGWERERDLKLTEPSVSTARKFCKRCVRLCVPECTYRPKLSVGLVDQQGCRVSRTGGGGGREWRGSSASLTFSLPPYLHPVFFSSLPPPPSSLPPSPFLSLSLSLSLYDTHTQTLYIYTYIHYFFSS